MPAATRVVAEGMNVGSDVEVCGVFRTLRKSAFRVLTVAVPSEKSRVAVCTDMGRMELVCASSCRMFTDLRHHHVSTLLHGDDKTTRLRVVREKNDSKTPPNLEFTSRLSIVTLPKLWPRQKDSA